MAFGSDPARNANTVIHGITPSPPPPPPPGTMATQQAWSLLYRTVEIEMWFIFYFFYFAILYWFCHTSTCIHQGCTRVPLTYLSYGVRRWASEMLFPPRQFKEPAGGGSDAPHPRLPMCGSSSFSDHKVNSKKTLWKENPKIKLKEIQITRDKLGTSLVVQWLRLHTPKAGGTDMILDWGSKIPHPCMT